jgi:hypothetical protein
LFQPKARPVQNNVAEPIASTSPEKPQPSPESTPPADTTSRLLAAKRRAQKKRD